MKTVSRLFALAAIATGLAVAPVSAADAPSPVGYWKTFDDGTNEPKSIVHIEDRGGKLSGTIVRLIRGPDEERNPMCDLCSGDRKGKPVIGMEILWDLEPKNGRWSGGKILDPENGKTYRCSIEIIENGDELKVRGYIGFSLLGRTQYWLREKEP